MNINLTVQSLVYVAIGLDDEIGDVGYEWKDSPGGMLEATWWLEEEVVSVLVTKAEERGVPICDLYPSDWLYTVCETFGSLLGRKIKDTDSWPDSATVSEIIEDVLNSWLPSCVDRAKN